MPDYVADADDTGELALAQHQAVLGLISEREIIHAFSRYGETVAAMPVREYMRHATTVSPDDSVNSVMNLMTRHRVRHMPVLRDGKLAGIISIGDVVRHRLDDLELETIPRLRNAALASSSGYLPRPSLGPCGSLFEPGFK